MSLRLEVATPAHVEDLLPRARQVDREEWVGALKSRLEDRLLDGLTIPGSLNRAVVDVESGRCLVLWGAHPTDTPGVGQAWLIATTEAEPRARSIHRFLRGGLSEMDERWGSTIAYSSYRNHLHHVWMRRAGYRLLAVVTLGLGLPYHVYTRTKGAGTLCAFQQPGP